MKVIRESLVIPVDFLGVRGTDPRCKMLFRERGWREWWREKLRELGTPPPHQEVHQKSSLALIWFRVHCKTLGVSFFSCCSTVQHRLGAGCWMLTSLPSLSYDQRHNASIISCWNIFHSQPKFHYTIVSLLYAIYHNVICHEDQQRRWDTLISVSAQSHIIAFFIYML